MNREITSCYSCPASTYSMVGQRGSWCRMLQPLERWAEDRRLPAEGRASPPPKWCPLRHHPITLSVPCAQEQPPERAQAGCAPARPTHAELPDEAKALIEVLTSAILLWLRGNPGTPIRAAAISRNAGGGYDITLQVPSRQEVTVLLNHLN